MSDYYNPSGTPGTGAQGISASMRAEFALIEAGFDKFPALTGNASKFLRVNSGESAVEAIAATGSGSVVLATSPTLVTPNLGAPTASGQITSTVTTGTAPLVIASATLVDNLYVARAALADTATTNANLTGPITSSGNATSVASQTGTGTKFVMDTSPTLVTPNIGVATATSVNKVTVTQPASSATLTIDNGKTLRASASLVLAGTDSTTMTFPGTSATIARIDAGQTFTGTQVFGAIDVNGGAIDGTPIGASSASSGKFTGVIETPNTYTPSSGAAVTVDWSNGGSVLTNSGTNALTFSNVPSGVAGHVLHCTNYNNTSFPAAVDWGVGGKESIAGAALVSLVTFDGGTTIYGCVMHQAV